MKSFLPVLSLGTAAAAAASPWSHAASKGSKNGNFWGCEAVRVAHCTHLWLINPSKPNWLLSAALRARGGHSRGWWCWRACGVCWTAWGSPGGCSGAPPPAPSAPCSNSGGDSRGAAWTGLWGCQRWSPHTCATAEEAKLTWSQLKPRWCQNSPRGSSLWQQNGSSRRSLMQLELFTAIISRGWLNTWKEIAAASFSISTNFLLQACSMFNQTTLCWF